VPENGCVCSGMRGHSEDETFRCEVFIDATPRLGPTAPERLATEASLESPPEAVSKLHQRHSSSLRPIGPTQSALFPRTKASRTQSVRVRRLGSVIARAEQQPPGLLQVDVQGYELACLGGCEDLLDGVDWVYVECSFIKLYTGRAVADQVITFLHEAGFRLVSVHHVSRDDVGAVVQGDSLFHRG